MLASSFKRSFCSKVYHNNGGNDKTYCIIQDIVSKLKKDRLDWKHWRFQQQRTSSADRHKLGRNVFEFCRLYPHLPSLFTRNNSIDSDNKNRNNENNNNNYNNTTTWFSTRRAILDYLITHGSVPDLPCVDELMTKYNDAVRKKREVHQEDKNKENEIWNDPGRTYLYHLRRSCTPVYEELVHLMLEMAAGVGLQCIVTVRQDLLQYKGYLKEEHLKQQKMKVDNSIQRKNQIDQVRDFIPMIEQLDILDSYLKQVLSIQFAPGFLDIRRITYQHSSASTIEAIARYEAVHPVQDLQDLRARLGLHRRVFGLFHPQLIPDYVPAVVLYVSLQSTIPSTMIQIHEQENVISEYHDNDDDNIHIPPKVATFYSISNLQSGLSGVGLGEYLIKQVVKKLRQEIPTLDTYVTLSPLPTFRKWLQACAVSISQSTMFQPPIFEKDGVEWVQKSDLEVIAKLLQCDVNDALIKLIERLDEDRNKSRIEESSVDELRSRSQQNISCISENLYDTKFVQKILTQLAAHYLIQEKHRRKPLDNVARFHVSNGAEVYRINYGADLSRKGWLTSFGIMVNYRYNLDNLQSNQDQYEADYALQIHENVNTLFHDK